MGSSRSLNVHAPWTEVLSVLGRPPAAGGLPARVACPLCGGPRMAIYEDTISGGAWHYCPDCKHAGDMIGLAAAAWGCGPLAAVRRLAAAGLAFPAEALTEAAVARYVADHPAYHARMLKFWAGCRSTCAGPAAARSTASASSSG
jgi:hypothetical protein